MTDFLRRRIPLTPLMLALIASIFFTLTSNASFLSAMAARAPAAHAPAMFVVPLAVAVTAIQFVLFAVFFNRLTVKPLLSIVIVLTASSVYFMHKFGVYMDNAMIRNILQTDFKESRELLALDMLPHLFFYAVLPLLFLWRVEIVRKPLRRSWYHRPVAILVALGVTVGALATVSQTFVPLMREHKELRFLITPSNYLYSLSRVAFGSGKKIVEPRKIVGADAKRTPAMAAAGRKPMVFVIVVGETARAANWGLNGYAHQTTPELAAMPDVINFPDVKSCGTNTEISVPCLFSHLGRRHYDEDEINHSESLLHVLSHAGVNILWRDNQSGCKGVCEGLPSESVAGETDPALCNGERCFDEILLKDLPAKIAATKGDLVIVMHQLGNHGPAYFQRYPAAYRRFTPTCDTTELGTCPQPAIVNSYDNAILYTDHMLAQAIALLKTQEVTHDTALMYFSDHGESLGENGLYLHSLPYAIAPDTQTHVPMIMWFSPGFAQQAQLDMNCLRSNAKNPAGHDNIFSTVLGAMGVQTTVYDRDMDLTATCRK